MREYIRGLDCLLVPVHDKLLTICPVRTAFPPVFEMIHQPRAQQEPPRHGPRRQEKPQWNDGVVTVRLREWRLIRGEDVALGVPGVRGTGRAISVAERVSAARANERHVNL